MKTIEIKNRWTGVILYTALVEDDDPYPIRTALERALADDVNLVGVNLVGANLADASLTRANLSNAYLRSANLGGADLSSANLCNVDLRSANLGGADLSNANLSGANLSGTDLVDANLAGAYLRNANLCGADLAGAYLCNANLCGAGLSGANLSGARYDDVPFVPRLDVQILELLNSGHGKLDMGFWHTCATTHCRAGWAVTLAGEAGRELETKIGTAAAGALIYHRSTGRVPNFYASNEDALADIVACARDQGSVR
jgi:hypothetical protein